MPAERSLLPRDIRRILEWVTNKAAIPTRKEIARELNVSEATVTRVARHGGYKPGRRRTNIEVLARRIELLSVTSVPTVEQAFKEQARAKSRDYLRRGIIQKEPCKVCTADDAEMHHEDYGDPLGIVWLCRKCHMDMHQERGDLVGADPIDRESTQDASLQENQ